MKKRFLMLIVTLLSALLLTGCGKFTCDLCGQERTGKKYKTEVLSHEVTICKECHDNIESLFGIFN